MKREEICLEIKAARRRARFAVKSQSRIDRSLESFIAYQVFGFYSGDDEAARKKIWDDATDLITKIRKGKCPSTYAMLEPLVSASDQSRLAWDMERSTAEKAMRKAASGLPGFAFVESVKGFGALGFAQIVGECGDISNYPNVAKVWKRMGCAPYQGVAMSTWRRSTWSPRSLSKDEWIANPFKPERYSILFNIGESLLKHQMESAEKSGMEFGRPLGPYGELYVKRREHTKLTHPDWTKMHARNDARRVVVKELLKDLWVNWHREAIQSLKSTVLMPHDIISSQDEVDGQRRSATLQATAVHTESEAETAMGYMKPKPRLRTSAKGERASRMVKPKGLMPSLKPSRKGSGHSSHETQFRAAAE
jgi:hypothetical protein